MKKNWLLSVLIFVFFGVSVFGDTIYVTQSGAGTGDGSSWANAIDGSADRAVFNAVNNASPGDKVWIAEGVYFPTTGTDRSKRFAAKDSVCMYGGFPADAATSYPTMAERDPWAYETVLSADIGTPNDTSDNAYNVIEYQTELSPATIIDGFTIRDGNSSGTTNWKHDNRGSALYPSYGDAGFIIRNCSFINNHNGETIFVRGGLKGTSIIENCRFINNSSSGGIINSGAKQDASLIVRNCIFANNYSSGGVLRLSLSGDTTYYSVYNNVFVNNKSANNGSAITIDHGYWPATAVEITNNIFYNNDTVMDITYDPGKINSGNCPDDGKFEVYNNLLKTDGTGIPMDDLIEEGNISGDPIFTNPITTLGVTPLADTAEYAITSASPCLNAGNAYSDTMNAVPDYDLEGKTRIMYTVIDMGAYEYDGPLPSPVVVDVAPDSNQTTVELDASIYVVFDKNIDSSDFSGIVIEDSGNNPVSGVSASITNDTLFVAHDNFTLNNEQYTVTIPKGAVNSFGAANDSVVWSFTTLVTGIEKQVQKPSVNIYPNPSNGNVNIEGLEEGAFVEISNAQGQIVYSQAADNNVENIDLSGIAKGVYLINIKIDSQNILEKLIIQ